MRLILASFLFTSVLFPPTMTLFLFTLTSFLPAKFSFPVAWASFPIAVTTSLAPMKCHRFIRACRPLAGAGMGSCYASSQKVLATPRRRNQSPKQRAVLIKHATRASRSPSATGRRSYVHRRAARPQHGSGSVPPPPTASAGQGNKLSFMGSAAILALYFVNIRAICVQSRLV